MPPCRRTVLTLHDRSLSRRARSRVRHASRALGYALMLCLLGMSGVHADHGTTAFPCEEGPFGVPGLQAPPEQIGRWDMVGDWPVQGTHAVLLHTGKVLWWRGEAPLGVPSTTYLWDPLLDTLEERQLMATNIFCAGHSTLADGRVLVQGGTANPNTLIDGLPDTNVFDPISQTWDRVSDSNLSRWYPTLTTLPDGKVLASSGLILANPREDATIPEIYDPETDTWTLLPEIERAQNLYPITFVLPDGRLLYSANFRDTLTLDLEAMTWTFLGDTAYAHVEGTGITHRPGEILRIGGGNVGIVEAEIIDMNSPTPAWRRVEPMSFPRRRLDLVLLPDGTALAVGGSVEGQSTPSCAMHAAELWDPNSESWTTMASHERPRIYHSTALLLPDGRVLAAGGEDSVARGQANAEVFSPPYLFRGPRPVVTGAPSTAVYGRSLRVDTTAPESIGSIALVRPGAVTHNFDQNQRYVPLDFVAFPTHLQVSAPANANLAPPGYYMMFIVDSDGVPSVAHWIRVTATVLEDCGDGEDNDDDGLIDGDDPDCVCPDDDADGFADCISDPDCNDAGLTCGDCNDLDDGSFPGAEEICDLRDNNCDGVVDEGFDGDGDGVTSCGGDCDDADPSTVPGAVESCDGIDNDCDPGTPDCPEATGISFFFNGEGCDSTPCTDPFRYTLDPVLEFSRGDTTGELVSRARVSTSAAIFGSRGLDVSSGSDQMRFDIVDDDLVSTEQGAFCFIVRNAGTSAASGHRLFISQGANARSYVSLEFLGSDDLQLRYRDNTGFITRVNTGAWNGAATPEAMLVQVSYDSTAAEDSLRLLVNGVERAHHHGTVPPLSSQISLRLGNSTSRTGAFHYDPFLISDRANIDCWDQIAGRCNITQTMTCVDDGHCPLGEHCHDVAQNYLDAALVDLCPSDPNKTDPGVCGCGVPDDDIDGDGTVDCPGSCVDNDGDGFGLILDESCLGVDCDDTDPDVHPGQPEIECDGLDNDCDPGTLDDPEPALIAERSRSAVTGSITTAIRPRMTCSTGTGTGMRATSIATTRTRRSPRVQPRSAATTSTTTAIRRPLTCSTATVMVRPVTSIATTRIRRFSPAPASRPRSRRHAGSPASCCAPNTRASATSGRATSCARRARSMRAPA